MPSEFGVERERGSGVKWKRGENLSEMEVSREPSLDGLVLAHNIDVLLRARSRRMVQPAAAIHNFFVYVRKEGTEKKKSYYNMKRRRTREGGGEGGGEGGCAQTKRQSDLKGER